MDKVKLILPEPAVFDGLEDLPNFVGHVAELDTTSQVFVEYASNVGHIKPFKVRMPLGWSEKIQPMSANENNGSKI